MYPYLHVGSSDKSDSCEYTFNFVVLYLLCIFGTTALPRRHPFAAWALWSIMLHHFIQRSSLVVLPPYGFAMVAVAMWPDFFLADQLCPSELWFKLTPQLQHHFVHCRHCLPVSLLRFLRSLPLSPDYFMALLKAPSTMLVIDF